MPQEFKIITKRNRLTVRFNYVIFPIVTGEIQNALAETSTGYALIPPPKTSPTPVGTSLDWNGPIARKENVIIDFDSLTQVIGVDGKDATESLNVFSEVLDIIKASIDSTIDDHAHFYELISNYSIETGEDPLERLEKIKLGGELYGKIKEIIQEPVSTYNFHICSPEKRIQSTDWFDINIRPATRRSTKAFDVMTVYRSKDKSKVDKFTNNYDDYIRKIFDELNKV